MSVMNLLVIPTWLILKGCKECTSSLGTLGPNWLVVEEYLFWENKVICLKIWKKSKCFDDSPIESPMATCALFQH